jgi:hypothetical protein
MYVLARNRRNVRRCGIEQPGAEITKGAGDRDLVTDLWDVVVVR